MLRLYIASLFGGWRMFGLVFGVLIVIIAPLIVAFLCYRYRWEMGDSLPSIVISSFSIFSAMLFASQVAAFSVFNYKILEAKPKDSNDEIIQRFQSEEFSRRTTELRGAFRRINSGITMLTLISVSITAITLVITASPPAEVVRILTAVASFLAAHFLASFTITCHQVFSFFDSAYLGEEI